MRRMRPLLISTALLAALCLLGCQQFAERTLTWSQRKVSEMMPWQVYGMCASPDGSKVALAASKGVLGGVGGKHALVVVDVAGGEVISRTLNARECDQPLQWRADGRILTRRYHVRELDFGEALEKNPQALRSQFPDVEPGGSFVPQGPQAASECWLVALDRPGADALPGRPGREGAACWAPDGKSLVFDAYPSSWQGEAAMTPDVTLAAGGKTTPLSPSSYLVGCARCTMHAVGWVAVVRRVQDWRSEYLVIDMPSRKVRPLMGWTPNLWAAAVSPNGEYLAVLAGRAGFERDQVPFSAWDQEPGWLVLVPLAGGTRKEIELGGPATALAWSGDSRRLALCGAYAGAWAYDLASGKMTRLAEASSEPRVCAWAGRRIVLGTASGEVMLQQGEGQASFRTVDLGLQPKEE